MATTAEKRQEAIDYLNWRDAELLTDPDSSVSADDYYAYLESIKDKVLLARIERIMSKGAHFQKWEAYDEIQRAITEARA